MILISLIARTIELADLRFFVLPGGRWKLRNDVRGSRKPTMVVAAAAAALGLTLGVTPLSAQAAPGSVLDRGRTGVTADALPTTQIDGVGWTQVVVGNRVFVGGQFQHARPAGAPPGTDEVSRSNLLAYDLTTGELDPSFAPTTNGAVLTLTTSVDKKTLFIGGDFTQVDGIPRSRFAALSLGSGSLTSMRPAFDSTVRVIRASKSRIFIGGSFTRVGASKRSKLAALTLSGKLSGWAPSADNYVRAMTLTPDHSRLVVGGSFKKIGKTTVNGMASIDVRSAKLQSWKINSTIKDYGQRSSIMSLTSDATRVYGSGYSYGQGNFEGAFAASPSTGKIIWLQDCRGDTYDVAVTGSRLYSVGHAHNCQNIGGFAEVKPIGFRALAVGTKASGTVGLNSTPAYNKFTNRPAPSLVNWFPQLAPGDYTGQSQAAWSVVATDEYVSLAGEFPAVNGTNQQGLVRFAISSRAPGKQGPLSAGNNSAPSVVAAPDGTASISWPANHDRDDQVLTYQVLRFGAPVATLSATSQFWNRPTLSATDSGLTPGSRYKYEIRASDPDGNSVVSASVYVTVPTVSSADPTPSPAQPATGSTVDESGG